jgi:hypothetical protein
MTDTQVLRKKVTESCKEVLTKEIKNGRLNQEEIKNLIINRVGRDIEEEFR